MLDTYQKDFINFLVKSDALKFGEFKLKSGRTAPYYINSGNFNDAEKIYNIGKFYSRHIVNNNLANLDIVFGPAYKGIPLAVSTCIALQQNHSINCGYSFDRKEVKEHGDGGMIVGAKIFEGANIVIVEDVITAGTTLKIVVPFLRNIAKVNIQGVVISVDREERSSEKSKPGMSALKEIETELDIKIFPLLTITQIVSYLSQENESGLILSPELLGKIKDYQKIYF